MVMEPRPSEIGSEQKTQAATGAKPETTALLTELTAPAVAAIP
jgi:hypothetical protein